MMDFPNMVYKCPGSHQCPGGTFDYHGVKNQAQLESMLRVGWSETLPEAMAQKYGAAKVEPILAIAMQQFNDELEILGDEPPTRDELEKQAGELGIKFNKKTTDSELNKKIIDALEG
jgi:hypothetical protein